MLLPDCIQAEDSPGGFRTYSIKHPACSASVAENGAHVMTWQPMGQDQPVLYLSPQATLSPGKAIRGGIPICWPWFNAHPSDPTKPMHGIARIQRWELLRADAQLDHVSMLFRLRSTGQTCDVWPHDFTCHVGISLGAKLEVSLMTQNNGTEAMVITEALHTYLAVGDIAQTTVRGLKGARYLDTVGTPAQRLQEGEITFGCEVDRQYVSTAGVVVDDPAWDRRLIIDKLGSGTTVVWNPWIDKSKRLPDLPDEAYRGFLCVEAANAGEAAVRLPPGGHHVIVTTLQVTRAA
ncbi:MAG: D-hexose-6-phosphate mutarotase [Prosthecobacter sp.]|nr:D-hexose-6-phosphate mutarotase [Prosthecobacter sp.]